MKNHGLVQGCLLVTGMLVSDIRSELQKFQQWSVHHVRRDANVIAHLLAKDALHIYDAIVLEMETFPPCIQALL